MTRIDSWHKLPLQLRQRFWDETDYDTKPASPELLEAMKSAINHCKDKSDEETTKDMEE